MSAPALFVCRAARGGQWRLGPPPPPPGRRALIGWTARPPDAGVPPETAAVLARALTAVARVTFPASLPAAAPAWSPAGADRVRTLGRGRLGFLSGGPSWTLLSTRSPESAARLFDDAGYPWGQQGQVALLSPAAGEPPAIDRAGLAALFREDWARRAAPPGVLGVLRPGVDGDVAGLLSWGGAFEESFLAALEAAGREAGFAWAPLSEDEFAERLA